MGGEGTESSDSTKPEQQDSTQAIGEVASSANNPEAVRNSKGKTVERRSAPKKKKRRPLNTPDVSDSERRIKWIQSMLAKKKEPDGRNHAWAASQLDKNFFLRKNLKVDILREFITDDGGLSVCDKVASEYNKSDESDITPAEVQVGYMRIDETVWPVEEIRWDRRALLLAENSILSK